MDIPFFDAVAEAPLMKGYTKDEIINKRAAMILNLQGGVLWKLLNLNLLKPHNLNEVSLAW